MGVLVLGGPTGAGKSDAALAVAEAFGARIVSADAMTVYRGLDIGTAKPPPDVLARFPHDCVDVRDPDEDFSVDDFTAAVAEAQEQAEDVLIVGGTPFYLAALVRPLSPLPPADPALRAGLEQLPDPHAALAAADPVTAARLHPRDKVRIIRALEVYHLTGTPLSALQRLPPRAPALAAEVVWLDREDLRPRIGARLQVMLERGYVAETEAILAAGWSRDLKPLRSFAYTHLVAHVQDGLPLDEAIRRTERDTWYLARKQRTWARGMGWAPADAAAVLPAAERAFSRR